MRRGILTIEYLFLRSWLGPAGAAAALVVAVGSVGFVVSRLLAAPVALTPASLGLVAAASLPAIASLALPIAAGLGTVALARRWQAEGEWVALQAAGVGIRNFLGPLLLIAAATGGACYALSHHVEPAARAAAADALARGFELRPGRLIRAGPVALSAREVDGSALRGVFFALDGDGPPRVGGAARGSLASGVLILEDGVLHDPGPPGIRVAFDRVELPIPEAGRRWELAERSDAALADLVARMEAHGKRAEYERAVLEKRSAWPVAAALLTLLALPLGLRGPTPPAAALVGYWVMVRVCDQGSASLGGALAAWLPTLLLASLVGAAWRLGIRR